MKLKIIALSMALLILAGCTPKTPKDSGADDNMVLAVSGDKQVTYAGYRTYVNVVEEVARISARKNLAYMEMLLKDLSAAEKPIDRAAFDAEIDPVIEEMMLAPDMQPMLTTLLPETGISLDQYKSASKMFYYMQTAYGKIDEHLLELATKEGKDMQTAVEEYGSAFDTRISFEKPDVLTTLDGVDIPYTKEYTEYVDYSGIVSRADVLNYIASYHLILDDMKAKNITIDPQEFAVFKVNAIAGEQSDPLYIELRAEALKNLGITEEEYNKQIDGYMMLRFSSIEFEKMIETEYNALPAEGKPETLDIYADTYFEKVLGDLKLKNISGK